MKINCNVGTDNMEIDLDLDDKEAQAFEFLKGQEEKGRKAKETFKQAVSVCKAAVKKALEDKRLSIILEAKITNKSDS
jgi:hypothetical protein